MIVTIKSHLFYSGGHGNFFIAATHKDDYHEYPVYLETATKQGIKGTPLCKGGRFEGQPLMASPKTLYKVAEHWTRMRIILLDIGE